MPLLEIYFFGLISHIGSENNADCAALIKLQDHYPYIVTPVPKKPIRRTPITDGVHVHFNGLGSRPILLPEFLEYVPSLKNVTRAGNDLRDDVKNEQNTNEVQAFVHLPDGEFGVSDFYKTQATFYLDGSDVRPKNCVARLTLLTRMVNDKTVTISVGKMPPIEVELPGWVLFLNGAQVPPEGAAERLADPYYDFHAHRLITKARSDTFIAKVIPEDDCPLYNRWQKGVYYTTVADEVDPLQDATQVECTNTRWP